MQRFGHTLCSNNHGTIAFRPSPNCWKASLEGGMDAYLNRLSKRVRKILRDASDEIESGRSRFHVASTLEEAWLLLPEISRVHQMRWQQKGIEGCFTENSFAQFLETATKALWSDPWSPQSIGIQNEKTTQTSRVHIAILKIDNQTAAGAICFRDRNSLSIYLTGMNPEFSRSKPGWQLLQGCIQHAISLGCDAIDFLRGDEEYKERLGGVASAQQRWVVPSMRWTSKLRFAAYRTATEIKSWWQAPTTANGSQH
jgi:CelD/BcsL family acetyltransferase involved in cellulose biosynthesis